VRGNEVIYQFPAQEKGNGAGQGDKRTPPAAPAPKETAPAAKPGKP